MLCPVKKSGRSTRTNCFKIQTFHEIVIQTITFGRDCTRVDVVGNYILCQHGSWKLECNIPQEWSAGIKSIPCPNPEHSPVPAREKFKDRPRKLPLLMNVVYHKNKNCNFSVAIYMNE